jgi:hypothetical protein
VEELRNLRHFEKLEVSAIFERSVEKAVGQLPSNTRPCEDLVQSPPLRAGGERKLRQ